MAMSLLFPATALVSFACYLAFAVLARIGGWPSPVRAFCRVHLYFTALYGALSAVAARAWLVPGAFSVIDCLVGLACYFFLQYSWFFVLFGQVSRGFSMNICVLLHRHGGHAPLGALTRDSEFIKSDRIRVMKESGVVQEHEGGLVLTTYGAFVTRLNHLVQRIWNLDYLGRT
jgi:hypothetical protein